MHMSLHKTQTFMPVSRRSPVKWPKDALLLISPCVAFETWPEDLGMRGSLNRSIGRHLPPAAVFKKDIRTISDRQFGDRVGIYRLVNLFEKHGVKTTFFLNGRTAERFPDLTKEIDRQGHEIATESYVHDYSFMKTLEEERSDLRKTVQAIKSVVGKPPLGYLSMGERPSDNSPQLAADEGYLYWVDPQHEELPYTLRVGGKELTVIPYTQYLNDYSTYLEDGRTPRQLLQIWKDTFHFLYNEAKTNPNLMMWGLHPFLIGRPHRAKVLDEFLEYVKGFPHVEFARSIDIVKWWRDNYRDSLVEQWPNCTRFSEPPIVSKAGFESPEYAKDL
jgi:peptidoglycan/xylan/chitin deacetylase (PgdA/CDA1 family)